MATAPTEDAPGSPKSGFISGDRIRLAILTMPNSEITEVKAPAMMMTPIRKKTVFRIRSWAVAIVVLSVCASPIFHAKAPNRHPTITRAAIVSR